MPEQPFGRLDFCKGFRPPKLLDAQAPLDTVTPVGLGSLDCFPLLSHHRLADGGILSTVNQQTLGRVGDLLDVANEPSDDTNTYPQATPGIAGVRASPVSGAPTLPYPASALTYEVLFSLDGQPQYRDLQGMTPTPTGNLINSDGLSQTILHQTGVWRDLLLGGPARYNGRSVFLPYHSYEYGVTYLVCPNGEPGILRYDSNLDEYFWPDPSLAHGVHTTRQVDPMQPFSLPEYDVRVLIWEATPAFAAFMTGQSLEPGTNLAFIEEANGPELGRKYVYHPFQTATMPAYGGAYTQAHAFTGARANLVLWANTDIDSVTINGIGGTSLPGSAPLSIFNTVDPTASQPYAYPTALKYAVDPFETVFTVQLTAFGGQVFDLTASPFTFSADNSVPRWYEGFALAFIRTT